MNHEGRSQKLSKDWWVKGEENIYVLFDYLGRYIRYLNGITAVKIL